jgi:hypothetical protein
MLAVKLLVEAVMVGSIGFLFWSVLVLAPAFFAVSIVGPVSKRGRLTWLGPAAVASGFLAGGVIGWASVPSEWTASLWTTIDAAGNAARYGHAFEHAAERALMYFFVPALLGELAFGLAALLVLWRLPQSLRHST